MIQLKRFYLNNQHYREDIQFIVELPVGYLNYFEKYHILKLVEKSNIDKLLPLRLSSGEVQIKDSFTQKSC